MDVRTQRRLGTVAVINGAALLIAPRLLRFDDPFGDRERIFLISGMALVLIGLVALLGIAEWGKGMAPKWSSLLRVSLGVALMLAGLHFSGNKGWGFLMLPFALVSTVLMTIGLRRRT